MQDFYQDKLKNTVPDTKLESRADMQKTASDMLESGTSVLEKPEWLPEKFWKDGHPQFESLAKSYRALELKLSQSQRMDTPVPDKTTPQSDTPKDNNKDNNTISVDMDTPYTFDTQGLRIERDTEFEQHLKKAGLTDKQAQAIYQVADTYLADFFEQRQHMQQQLLQMDLAQYFGGMQQWHLIQPVLSQWANDNLPADTVAHLASSAQGIKALHKMMTAHGEPRLLGGHNPNEPLNKDSLRKMMDNPKYWRERDPAYIEKVQQGFKTLYG